MKLTLPFPDDLYEVYRQYAKNPKDPASVESAILAQLKRFAEYRPQDRVLVVPSGVREKLEEALPGNPGPSIHDAADLLARVKLLASVEIGSIKIPFTLKQLEYLKVTADRQGRTVQEITQDTVDRMADLFFDNLSVK